MAKINNNRLTIRISFSSFIHIAQSGLRIKKRNPNPEAIP